MKKKPEPITTSESDLFRQALEGVTPITAPNRILPPRPIKRTPSTPPASSPVATDNWSDHGADEAAPTSYLRNGLNNMTLRKLRRGQWPIQDNIDLHGHTSEEARVALLAFLTNALNNNYRCVSVIHGKGWRAEGGEGILKIRVRHWLTQQAQVLAFCEPAPSEGGGGAVIVLLKISKI